MFKERTIRRVLPRVHVILHRGGSVLPNAFHFFVRDPNDNLDFFLTIDLHFRHRTHLCPLQRDCHGHDSLPFRTARESNTIVLFRGTTHGRRASAQANFLGIRNVLNSVVFIGGVTLLLFQGTSAHVLRFGDPLLSYDLRRCIGSSLLYVLRNVKRRVICSVVRLLPIGPGLKRVQLRLRLCPSTLLRNNWVGLHRLFLRVDLGIM